MPEKNQIKKIKQNALQRRLKISLAGARGGTRLLTSHASSVFLAEDKKKDVRQQALAREARLFTVQLGELKGAYVKIGQMLALYGDYLLPKAVTDALHELEHNTSSLEWSAIEPVIQNTLGVRYQELTIEQQPIAAASLAQVHRATRKSDGHALCIKVQYPGVADTIEADFKAVLQMLKFARRAQTVRDFESWAKDIKNLLIDEVDYGREHKMTARMARLVGHDQRFLVPVVDARYSGSQILTMDYLEGLEVTHERVAALSQKRRNLLAKAMLELLFREIFEWGLVQTDPNFGNYRIQLRSDPAACDKLVLLDFGAVRELDTQFLRALQKTILGAYLNNRQQIIDGAIALNCIRESQTDQVKESFADFCILLMEPFRTDRSAVPAAAVNAKNQYRWHKSNLLRRVGKMGAKSVVIDGFSSPPKEFALIARKLTGVFSFVVALRAEINAHKMLDQYL